MVVCVGALCIAESARAQTVSGLALPTRRGNPQRVAAQLQHVTSLVQQALAPKDATAPALKPELNLSSRLQHAHEAFVAGQLDEAATEMDTAITDGVHRLDALRDPQQFLQALLIRATIGLARGEGERVGELLDRALRYEPSLELSASERSPAMRAALERARQRTGPHPEIHGEDLGGACSTVPMLIVARVLDEKTLELSRFDECRFIAAAQLGGTLDENAAAALLVRAAPGPGGIVADVPALRDRPVAHRPHGWVFGVIGGVGIAVAGIGAGLAGSVVSEYNHLESVCAGGTCPPSTAEPYQRRETAGYVLIGLGTATAAADLIAWLVLRRRP